MKTQTAYFNRFSLDMPIEAIQDCSHQGACDDDVEHWAHRITRPDEITPEALRAELKEYGAWDSTELDDDAQNWQRIIWLAAGNLKEEAFRANLHTIFPVDSVCVLKLPNKKLYHEN